MEASVQINALAAWMWGRYWHVFWIWGSVGFWGGLTDLGREKSFDSAGIRTTACPAKPLYWVLLSTNCMTQDFPTLMICIQLITALYAFVHFCILSKLSKNTSCTSLQYVTIITKYFLHNPTVCHHYNKILPAQSYSLSPL